MRRRDFLAAMARTGLASATVAAVPRFARAALLAAPAPADFIELNDWPEHWETTLAGLGRSWITSNDRFFVRSHFPAPTLDPATWRLEVAGLVRTPLSLTLADLKAGGVRLARVLERAGVQPQAEHVWFEAADRATLPSVPPFLRSIPLEKALRDTLLAHTMNGAPLPRLHGAPLRAIVPGWYGMARSRVRPSRRAGCGSRVSRGPAAPA
jgi:DMSO/TMAO reductase YedYZ molybdopterin-dependent catalytic subunit